MPDLDIPVISIAKERPEIIDLIMKLMTEAKEYKRIYQMATVDLEIANRKISNLTIENANLEEHHRVMCIENVRLLNGGKPKPSPSCSIGGVVAKAQRKARKNEQAHI